MSSFLTFSGSFVCIYFNLRGIDNYYFAILFDITHIILIVSLIVDYLLNLARVTLMGRGSWVNMVSKSEGDLSDCHILLLLELIFKSGEELRVDFTGELFHIFYGILQIFFFVTRPLFHLAVPSINLLNCLSTKNE